MLLDEIMMTEEQILASPMLEMANLAPGSTGLPTVVWMGKIGGMHDPRIKVSNKKGGFAEDDNFVINVDKEPRVLTPKSVKLKSSEVNEIEDWIKLNYDALMVLWKHFESGEGDTVELLSKLKKL